MINILEGQIERELFRFIMKLYFLDVVIENVILDTVFDIILYSRLKFIQQARRGRGRSLLMIQYESYPALQTFKM